MTDFERKRLEYFIKAAKNQAWVQFGPGDENIFKLYLDLKETWFEVQKKKEFIKNLQSDLGEYNWLEAELASEQIPIDKPE